MRGAVVWLPRNTITYLVFTEGSRRHNPYRYRLCLFHNLLHCSTYQDPSAEARSMWPLTYRQRLTKNCCPNTPSWYLQDTCPFPSTANIFGVLPSANKCLVTGVFFNCPIPEACAFTQKREIFMLQITRMIVLWFIPLNFNSFFHSVWKSGVRSIWDTQAVSTSPQTAIMS